MPAPPPKDWDLIADVVVVGSSGGGLLASIVLKDGGADAVVLERGEKLGGGTAYSSGLIWVPNNHHMKELGVGDSRDEALTHLRRIAAGRHSEELMQTYVDASPEMVRYVEEHTKMTLHPVRGYADYYAELEGGKTEGRYLAPEVFEAKKELGDLRTKLLASPHLPLPLTLHELMEAGGLWAVRKLDFRMLAQRVEEDVRGFGSALAGYLVKACVDRSIPLMLGVRAKQLVVDDGRVAGVRAEREGRDFYVQGRRGVILASGGFEWNGELNKRYVQGPEAHPYTPPTNEGDGLLMAMKVGAATAMLDETGWTPVVAAHGEEHGGRPLHRVLVRELVLPGSLVVNRQGRRFANEAFYRHLLHSGMLRFDGATQKYPNLPCYVVFDQRFKDRYPVVTVLPGDPAPDWFTKAPTLRELAAKLEVDPNGLKATVTRFNEYARRGVDQEFRRGETAYERSNGDRENKPNPCLAPIEAPPFYGLEVKPGSFGSRGGVVVNREARVLDTLGDPIPGLYACSNVVAQLAVGYGYNSGVSIGNSMTFGYIAAKSIHGGSAAV